MAAGTVANLLFEFVDTSGCLGCLDIYWFGVQDFSLFLFVFVLWRSAAARALVYTQVAAIQECSKEPSACTCLSIFHCLKASEPAAHTANHEKRQSGLWTVAERRLIVSTRQYRQEHTLVPLAVAVAASGSGEKRCKLMDIRLAATSSSTVVLPACSKSRFQHGMWGYVRESLSCARSNLSVNPS